MFGSLLRKFLRKQAFSHGRFAGAYRKFCKPDGLEYAEFLKRHGGFHGIGNRCRIMLDSVITDPHHTRLGNNVSLSACALIGHDGSIAVLNEAYNVKLDAVGKIDVKDNVFIGYNAIVLPNVTIGPNAIVAAGAVVTKDVPPDSIVAGVPARVVGKVSELVAKREQDLETLPWGHLIKQRVGPYDPEMEPELNRLRKAYFFPAGS
jgi:acetyltransferase-like isoleucine patch superfamily enzyme